MFDVYSAFCLKEDCAFCLTHVSITGNSRNLYHHIYLLNMRINHSNMNSSELWGW
jgi:hypothetical protein